MDKRPISKEKKAEYQKRYVIKNADKVKQSRKKYNDSAKGKAFFAEYNQKNKNKIRIYKNNWYNNKFKNDPIFKLRELFSNYIYVNLKKNGSSKNNNSIINFLPYSFEELKNHIENQFEYWMTWENWGPFNKDWNDSDFSTWTWQIDHIVPQSKLLYTSMEDENFKKCWSLENLRPYSSKDNIVEGNRR